MQWRQELLADLMNGNSVYIIHLVEFVNAHHPSVSQDHGSRFQLPVTCSSKHTPQYCLEKKRKD